MEKARECSKLPELTGVQRPEDFSFLSIDHMEQETQGGYFLVEHGYGNTYRIFADKDSNEFIQHPDFLDVTRSVIIAVNWDEEVICLDYRESSLDPVVVLSVWPETNDGTLHWKTQANNFREFADTLDF